MAVTPQMTCACAQRLIDEQLTVANIGLGRVPRSGGWSKAPALYPADIGATVDALEALEYCSRYDGQPQLGLSGRHAAAQFVTAWLEKHVCPCAKPDCDCENAVTLQIPRVEHVAKAVRALLTQSLQPMTVSHEPRIRALKWLNYASTTNGRSKGWGSWPKSPELGFLPSYHGVWALDEAHQRLGVETKLRHAGREYLSGLGEGDAEVKAWRQTTQSEGEFSPAATALAVISLSGGKEEAAANQRSAAAAGARWLIANADTWQGAWEPIHHGQGQFPSFALCALACLRSPLSYDEVAPTVGRALAYIDSIWKPDAGGWRRSDHGPFPGTTRVILALAQAFPSERTWTHTLGRAPATQRPKPEPLVQRMDISSRLASTILMTTFARKDSARSIEVHTKLAPAEARALGVLVNAVSETDDGWAFLSAAAAGYKSRSTLPVPVGAFRAALMRANKSIAKSMGKNGSPSCADCGDLVQPIRKGETDEGVWLLWPVTVVEARGTANPAAQ